MADWKTLKLYCHLRKYSHLISAILCNDLNLIQSPKLSSMTKQLKNGNILLIQLFNRSIMDEVKFLEALFINMNEFDKIKNICKEIEQLKLFKLNDNQLKRP